MKNRIDINLTIPNQTRYLRLIAKIGEDLARGLDNFKGDRETVANNIKIVLTEAVANVIKHANGNDPDKEVRIRISISGVQLVIRVYDQGEGFDLDTVPEPPLDQLDDRGRGIFIIKSLMDSVKYSMVNGRNVLKMKKRLS